MGPSAGIADVWCGVEGCKFTGGYPFLKANFGTTTALVPEVHLLDDQDTGYGWGHTWLCADYAWVSRDDWCQGWLYWSFGPDNGWSVLLFFQSSNLEVQVVKGKVKAWVWDEQFRHFLPLSAEAAAFYGFDWFHGNGRACIIDTAMVHEIWAEVSFFAPASFLWSCCWFGGSGRGCSLGFINFRLFAFSLCLFFQF